MGELFEFQFEKFQRKKKQEIRKEKYCVFVFVNSNKMERKSCKK